eukprot:TRINITY_DN14696_c0_g1_i1.p1 TRINITY_DN14696_c0_g1~~TRINITY_DN14696_c0_g1_i1.p1  ORF type:complete len:170 (+),score=50.31 TRINITY_DN14696_c0_g1_i1:107-616(+)
MNSINRKLINPLVKKTFQRRDVGHACLGLLTVGALGVTAFFTRKSCRGRMAEDYNRMKMIQTVNGAALQQHYAVEKELQAVLFGVVPGVAFGMLSRNLARGYLKHHQVFALRELLHVHRNVYLPLLSLACLSASVATLRATLAYYDRYPDSLDHVDRFTKTRKSWLWIF